MSGYKYLKRGEYVQGEVTETGGKKKLSNIRAPMEGGKLMCEVDLEDARDGLVRLDRLGSAPDGDVDGEVRQDSVPEVREVGSGSAPVREGTTPEVRAGRPEGGRPNRGRQCSRF